MWTGAYGCASYGRSRPTTHHAWKLLFDELDHTPDFIVADAGTGLLKAVREFYKGGTTFVPSLVHVREAIEEGLLKTPGAWVQATTKGAKELRSELADHLAGAALRPAHRQGRPRVRHARRAVGEVEAVEEGAAIDHAAQLHSRLTKRLTALAKTTEPGQVATLVGAVNVLVPHALDRRSVRPWWRKHAPAIKTAPRCDATTGACPDCRDGQPCPTDIAHQPLATLVCAALDGPVPKKRRSQLVGSGDRKLVTDWRRPDTTTSPATPPDSSPTPSQPKATTAERPTSSTRPSNSGPTTPASFSPTDNASPNRDDTETSPSSST